MANKVDTFVVAIFIVTLLAGYCNCNTVFCPEGKADSVKQSGKCEMSLPDIDCFEGTIPGYCTNTTYCDSCNRTEVSTQRNCSRILSIDSSLNRATVYVKVEFCKCICDTIVCEPTYTYRVVQHALSTVCQKQITQNTYEFGSGYGGIDDDDGDNSDMEYSFDYESSSWIENENIRETPIQNSKGVISLCPMFGLNCSGTTQAYHTFVMSFAMLVISVAKFSQ